MLKRKKLKPRGGKSKQKGSKFERWVCHQLSLWVSDGTREDVFWRSAMSGGRSTVAAKKGKQYQASIGDISAIHPSGEPFLAAFLVECKAYRDLRLDSFLWPESRGKKDKLWHRPCRQAIEAGRLPLIIAKQNALPVLVLTTRQGMGVLAGGARRGMPFVPVAEFAVHPDQVDCVVYRFDSFLALDPKRVIHAAARNL